VWTEPWLAHGFLGRNGGVSLGPYESLNLGYWVGDQRAAVDENWSRVRRVIGEGFTIARASQVHGADVQVVDERNAGASRTGDGMVTASPEVMLSIFTADCVPVLLVDARARVVGALHAGWRGILASIAARGVEAMTKLGAQPSRIEVATGPCIGVCCFEVDIELADRFEREIPSSARHRRPGRPGKSMLDLRSLIGDQLVAAGVASKSIIHAGGCTRCASDRYFSRRAAGGVTTGLQLSFIGIRP
jgi:hypothetical protein